MGDQIVVGLIAQLRVIEEVVGQARLPDHREVRIPRELRGCFTGVVQQIVERLPGAYAEIRVQSVSVADVLLGGDTERSEIVVGRLDTKAWLQVVERRDATGVLPERCTITSRAEVLPNERTLVERFIFALPTLVVEFTFGQAGQHGHQVRIRVVGHLGVTQHLYRAQLLQRLHGIRHHSVEVYPRNRIDADDQHAERFLLRIRSSCSFASFLELRITGQEDVVILVYQLVVARTFDLDEFGVDGGGVIEFEAVVIVPGKMINVSSMKRTFTFLKL